MAGAHSRAGGKVFDELVVGKAARLRQAVLHASSNFNVDVPSVNEGGAGCANSSIITSGIMSIEICMYSYRSIGVPK